jgi:hypothetical protein
LNRISTNAVTCFPPRGDQAPSSSTVSTILEGAVQKAGDKVRVNVQLIDARADTHLWAKSNARDLRDVLAVKSEVSQEIAEALQANLSPSESHALASARTHDTEVYDLFLRGEYEFHQAQSSFAADALAVPTRFTGRRWHAIQILPWLLRGSPMPGCFATGSSLR